MGLHGYLYTTFSNDDIMLLDKTIFSMELLSQAFRWFAGTLWLNLGISISSRGISGSLLVFIAGNEEWCHQASVGIFSKTNVVILIQYAKDYVGGGGAGGPD